MADSHAPVPVIDPYAHFRHHLGAQKKLQDRRVFWANPDREDVSTSQLSGGERKARKMFWHQLGLGQEPVDAVSYALCLHAGPIPGLQTDEEFKAYWNPQRLGSIAARWKKSRHQAMYARVKVDTAQHKLVTRLPDLADKLLAIVDNPEASHKDVIAAVRAIAERLPKTTWDEPEQRRPIRLPEFIAANAGELENEFLRIAATEKDPTRAKNLMDAIKYLLSKNMPEKYGEKIDVNMNHVVDLKTPLAKAEERDRAFVESRIVARLLKPAGDEAP